MNSGIDYRYLKAFYLTAEYLNFSKAAQELNIAQSAVSRQIKLLEESIGEQLIVRSSKKVLLTDKGKSLHLSISRFEEMTTELSKSSGPQIIKIGILHGLLENWFTQVVKEFTKKSKHSLRVEADTPANLKESLLAGKVDVIFTTENIQSDLVTSLNLFKEELALISKKDVDPKKIDSYPWLVYSDNDFFFDLYKKKSNKIITIKSVTSIIKLVKEGVGIAIVPKHTIKKEGKLKVQQVKVLKRPQIHMSTLSYQKLPGHLQELSSIVQEGLKSGALSSSD